MANKLKPIALVLLLVAAFLAGGWFFRQLPNLRAPKGEVEELYQADGEALGVAEEGLLKLPQGAAPEQFAGIHRVLQGRGVPGSKKLEEEGRKEKIN